MTLNEAVRHGLSQVRVEVCRSRHHPLHHHDHSTNLDGEPRAFKQATIASNTFASALPYIGSLELAVSVS